MDKMSAAQQQRQKWFNRERGRYTKALYTCEVCEKPIPNDDPHGDSRSDDLGWAGQGLCLCHVDAEICRALEPEAALEFLNGRLDRRSARKLISTYNKST